MLVFRISVLISCFVALLSLNAQAASHKRKLGPGVTIITKTHLNEIPESFSVTMPLVTSLSVFNFRGNVTIMPSSDEKFHFQTVAVGATRDSYGQAVYTFQSGHFEIKAGFPDRGWWEWWLVQSFNINVKIPPSLLGDLKIKTRSGNVSINNFSSLDSPRRAVQVNVVLGNIRVDKVVAADAITVYADNGKASVTNCTSENIQASTYKGDVIMDNNKRH